MEAIKDFYDRYKLFPLFKCLPNKKPNVEKGKSWQDEKKHIRTLDAMEGRTWGLICGELSNVIVIDIDGDMSVLDDLMDEIGLNLHEQETIKSTLTIRTPSGGYHLYFKYKEGLKGATKVFSTENGDIDIRTQGNYVVAPYSKAQYMKKGHKIDGEYIPINSGPIEQMPSKLFGALKKGKMKVKDRFVEMSLDPFWELKQIGEGVRNDSLNKVLFTYCAYKCLREKEVIEAVADKANTYFEVPLPIKEVKATARSVYSSLIAEEDKQFPFMNKKTVVKCWENTKWLLDEMGIEFKYNVISKKVEVNDIRLKELSYDAIITDIHGMCQKLGYNLTLQMVRVHISTVAELNKYNPVAEYLRECYMLWDGESRIEKLFESFKLGESANKELSFKLFKKWLISCVVMAFNENGEESAQGVLTLKGKAGIGKTRWLYSICPNPDWAKEGGKLNPTNIDSVRKHTQYWIVELGEVGGTIRKELINELKNFITEKKDTYRIPYAIESKEHPRMTVYMATVNDDRFLKDETGDRRFWVIPVDEVILPHGIDLDLLWGEVTSLVLDDKEVHYLVGEEIEQVMKSNEEYQVKSEVEQLLLEAFIWDAPKKEWGKLTSSELCKVLSLPVDKNVRVGRALRKFNREGRGIEVPKNTGAKEFLVPPIKSHYKSLAVIPSIDFERS